MHDFLIRYFNAPEYPITCTINTFFCIIYKFLHTNKLALTNTKNLFSSEQAHKMTVKRQSPRIVKMTLQTLLSRYMR